MVNLRAERIFSKVEQTIKKYQTRNPYELLDAMGAVIKFSKEYKKDGLKGYCAIMNRTMYVIINAKLDEFDRAIVAGHEMSHLILHKAEILASPAKMMNDFNLFDNSGSYEREANSFLADFLTSDENVLDVVSNDYMDYFEAACELSLPPPLLAFKLYSMMQRGYDVHNPFDLNNRFLRDSRAL